MVSKFITRLQDWMLSGAQRSLLYLAYNLSTSRIRLKMENRRLAAENSEQRKTMKRVASEIRLAASNRELDPPHPLIGPVPPSILHLWADRLEWDEADKAYVKALTED